MEEAAGPLMSALLGTPYIKTGRYRVISKKPSVFEGLSLSAERFPLGGGFPDLGSGAWISAGEGS